MKTSQPLRALLVSYLFPPVGGAGVQRVMKLAKYLPEHNVAPRVLTASNPSVPVFDSSLLRDLPSDIPVARVKTFEPGYASKQRAWDAERERSSPGLGRRVRLGLARLARGLARQTLLPDPQILWQPAAQVALWSELRRGTDVVFISGPPFSQFLLAPLAQRRAAVVLDYRDEWSTYRTTYEMMGGTLARLVGNSLEGTLLRRANVVTTATEEFREGLLTRFPFLDPHRVHSIPNGYDPPDFPTELPQPSEQRLVLAYAGTVFKLTSARGLLGAIRRVWVQEPELARLLSVRFMGRVVETELDAFAGSDLIGVARLGYLPHAEVLRELAASHLVLCILDDVPGVERIFPAKIFELMYLGRPILTLAPDSALARLVSRHRLGTVLPPRDEVRIAEFLIARLRSFKSGVVPPVAGAVDIGRYARRALAGEFAELFRDAVADRNRRS